MTYANDRLSSIFSALADPSRRGIFDDLRKTAQSVTDLAVTRPISRPAVSQHLKVLENADLVFATPRGSHRIYSAHADGLADLRRYLDRVWDQALLAYAAEITKQATIGAPMIPPIEKSITVPCDQKLAFDTFLVGMGTWWPLGKFTYSAMQGAPATDIRVDPRVGGEITEIGAEGAETSWGHVETYDPNSFMALRFHIPAPGYENGGQTLLEVRFTATDGGTQVDLRQSDFEAIGEMAEPSRGGYGQGWTMIFEGAYAAACAAKAG